MRIDLTNKIFDRLTVIGFEGDDVSNKQTMWRCRCICGNETIVARGNLRNRHTRSCGCLKKDTVTTHDKSKTSTYVTWGTMKRRCLNISDSHYKNYGGRGIKVCDRWLNSFENFLEDMGERPDGLTLDRINNNGNYEPSNCRWATRKQQSNNMRRNVNITFNGKTQTLTQWANELNMKVMTLYCRIYRGWSVERALTSTVREV